MTIPEISRILFVGAGQMGCANSLTAAVSGYDVVLHDTSPDALLLVPERHEEIGAFLVGAGYCTQADLDEALSQVTVETDLAVAVEGADLVSESIIEDAAIKRQVFARLDELAGPSTILTTNTSALLVSELESAVGRGDRFAALHSHLGALLFDIVGGPRTTPTTIDVLRRYVESLGGVPLVLEREHKGYVFNSLNGSILRASLRLLVDELADQQTVDRAWMLSLGAPMGPFGMIDLFGIDVVTAGFMQPADDPRRQALQARVKPLLAGYVAAGRLGMKTGAGFYDYPEPAYQEAGFLDAAPVEPAVADALTGALLCAAAELDALDVASPADIDMAWTTATGQSDGPFAIARLLDTERLRVLLDGQVRLGIIDAAKADAMAALLHR